MEIFIYVMIGVAVIAAIDRIFGNKIGLSELKKVIKHIAITSSEPTPTKT